MIARPPVHGAGAGRPTDTAAGRPPNSAAHLAVVERVRRRLVATGADPTPGRVAEALRAEGDVLGDHAVLAVVTMLRQAYDGAGALAPLLAEAAVTDVLVNGPEEVWVDRGDGLERVDVHLGTAADVRHLAQRLAARAGRRLDDAAPWVDARLPDGTRLHAVLPPVAPHGPLLSLRVLRAAAFTLEDLVTAGSVAPEAAECLRALVAQRCAFLVTGGTGTGKTTLLATLLGLVPATERVVLCEDSGELRPDHPHVVRLEARPPNVEGAGAVTLRDLVRQALRMRPDRLVVGEVRGAECVDLLAALNTGHQGGCGTVHANAPAAVPARLEALGVAAGLDRGALHAQLAAGLDVIVHLVRDGAGRRRLGAIGVLERTTGLVRVVPALTVGPDGSCGRGAGAGALDRLLARRQA
jgi:pilus assembly protein CpaF